MVRLPYLLLSCLAAVMLAGCAYSELYEPYTVVHPRTGAVATCGHWIWWECDTFQYERRQGFERLPDPLRPQGVTAGR